MENLFDIYHTKLKNTEAPIRILLEYYEKLFSIRAGRSDLESFNRFVKIYGRWRTFYTLTKIATRYTKIRNIDGLEKLMSVIISSDAREQKEGSSFFDSPLATERLELMKERLEKNKQGSLTIVFPNVFEDEVGEEN